MINNSTFFCSYKDPISYYESKALLFALLNFQCDCQECINDSYRFKLFAAAILIMNRKNFVKAKKLLTESWQKLNSGSQENWDYELQTFLILRTLAYYATFPY